MTFRAISATCLPHALIESQDRLRNKSRACSATDTNAQGEYLVKYAKEALLQLHHTKQTLWSMEEQVSGVLRLGVSGSIAAYKLPTLLKRFLE